MDEVLNTELRYGEFNLLNCNVSSINYIVNRITSFLLIERFIKWLELIKQFKRFRSGSPDDNIPMYLAPCSNKYFAVSKALVELALISER